MLITYRRIRCRIRRIFVERSMVRLIAFRAPFWEGTSCGAVTYAETVNTQVKTPNYVSSFCDRSSIESGAFIEKMLLVAE